LVFQNAGGQIAAWFLDGTGTALNFSTGAGLKPGSKLIYASSTGGYSLKTVADVNGDGIGDLLFQNTTGQLAVWFLDGTGNVINHSTGSGLVPGSKIIYSGALTTWRLAGAADLNGDGIVDFVFQDANGTIACWILDGTGNAINFTTGSGLKPGSQYLYSSPIVDYKILATRDINGDGTTDFIFQNTAGQLATWCLNGTGAQIDFNTGSGVVPGSKVIYSSSLGDWRVR